MNTQLLEITTDMAKMMLDTNTNNRGFNSLRLNYFYQALVRCLSALCANSQHSLTTLTIHKRCYFVTRYYSLNFFFIATR